MFHFKYTFILFSLIYLNFIEAEDSEESNKVSEDAQLYNGEGNIDLKNLLIDEAYDDSMFFRKIKRPNRQSYTKTWSYKNSTCMLNCFGICNSFSKMLEFHFKKEANGTRALKVFFHLYLRNATEKAVMSHEDMFSIEDVGFDVRKRTIFIVPGFLVDGSEKWVLDMKEALLLWDDINVFVVDWGDGANSWNYFKAAVNTVTVGDQMATFINQLSTQTIESNIPPNEWGPLHLIGHSLGAHIAGYAAKELIKRNGTWLINRITGLDPAQPCYRFSNPDLRLDSSDAEFVDIIHTNGRLLQKLGLGLPYQMGHVDFYPNGGIMQPGCILSESPIWKYLHLPIDSIKSAICSHGISHDYLTESIIMATDQNCTFWARDWDMSFTGIENILTESCKFRRFDRCIEMGINAEKYDGNGTYFVITGDSAPYCDIDSSVIEKIKLTLNQNVIDAA